MSTINEGEKISLTTCKNILNKNGNKYTDEEIKTIRDWLYFLAELQLSQLEKLKNKQL